VKARLASQNPHKLEELRAALPGWELELLDVDEQPEETGATYDDNARIKAEHGRAHAPADAWVLGEDSGIECDALAGAPGAQSARWAPAARQAEALLKRLGQEPNRRARMVCTIIALPPEGEAVRAAGVLEGEVARDARGSGGFGYDPVFVPDDDHDRGHGGPRRTMAELADAEKDAISHRGRAARALRAWLGA